MNNVQFEDQYQQTYNTSPKGIEGLVMRAGLAKTKKGAQMVLVAVVIGAIIIGFGAPVLFGGSANDVSDAEIEAAFQ